MIRKGDIFYSCFAYRDDEDYGKSKIRMKTYQVTSIYDLKRKYLTRTDGCGLKIFFCERNEYTIVNRKFIAYNALNHHKKNLIITGEKTALQITKEIRNTLNLFKTKAAAIRNPLNNEKGKR
jgi:hypothetical protein